jgi:hypothetical protein
MTQVTIFCILLTIFCIVRRVVVGKFTAYFVKCKSQQVPGQRRQRRVVIPRVVIPRIVSYLKKQDNRDDPKLNFK